MKRPNNIGTASDDMLHIKGEKESFEARLNLSQGGRITSWKQQGIEIIGDPIGQPYSDTFAGAILAPFANRIKDGRYLHEGKTFELTKNESGINAIHGLLYNQHFTLKKELCSAEGAQVHLACSYNNTSPGYSFLFDLDLQYRFRNSGLDIKLVVLNKDRQAMPLTLGWHPYFNLNQSEHSVFSFNPDLEFVMDTNGIPTGQMAYSAPQEFRLGDLELDTAYRLKTGQFVLKTESYQINFNCPAPSNYLQLYTPTNRNYLAIEPMTGISNSFNSGEGLMNLQPSEQMEVIWSMEAQLTNN